MKHNRNYWSKEKCQEIALKYTSRKNFRENEYCYQAAKKNGWLNDICSHMQIETKKQPGYWSKERCKDKASKCFSRNEFKDNFKSAYTACLRNNWLDDVCSNLRGYKSHGYWTKENCHKEALKYDTRINFRKGSSWAYRIALKNDWMNDICSHMKIIGNLFNRCIYVYEFTDNYAYVGLTFNLDNRHNKHLSKGPVHKHIQINPNYILKQLSDYIDVDEAKKLEDKYVKDYKKNNWNILNIKKTGGIGGRKYWTKKRCEKEALKYKIKSDFTKSKAYIPSLRNGWLEEITKNMIQLQKPDNYWTKEKCHEEALLYTSRFEFFKKSSGVYNKSLKNKWLDEICSHMKNNKYEPKGYWTKEKCHEEALKYNEKRKFRKYSSSAYSISIQNKWINEICSHMIEIKKPNGYWTKEKCEKEALKYSKITEFRKKCSSAYNSAKKNKWLDNIRKLYK